MAEVIIEDDPSFNPSPRCVANWEKLAHINPVLFEEKKEMAWDKVVNLGGLAGQVRELREENKKLKFSNTKLEKKLELLTCGAKRGSVSEMAKKFGAGGKKKSTKVSREELLEQIADKDAEIAALVEAAEVEEREAAAAFVEVEENLRSAVEKSVIDAERIEELAQDLSAANEATARAIDGEAKAAAAAAATATASAAAAAGPAAAAAAAASAAEAPAPAPPPAVVDDTALVAAVQRAETAERRVAELEAALAAAETKAAAAAAPPAPPTYHEAAHHVSAEVVEAVDDEVAGSVEADGVDAKMVLHFCELTHADRETAARYLTDNGFDVEGAIRAFFHERDGAAARTAAQEESDFALAQALHAAGDSPAGGRPPRPARVAAPAAAAAATAATGSGGQGSDDAPAVPEQTAEHIEADAHVARGLLREEVQMRGTLDKMARISKARGNWTRRYFELHGDVLSYFKDEASVFKTDGTRAKARGTLRLTRATILRLGTVDRDAAAAAATQVESSDRAYWFELEQTGQPSLTAAASSQSDLDAWVRALRQGIALAHRGDESETPARGRAGSSGGANWAARTGRALRKSFNLAPSEEASVTTHHVLARAPLGSAIDFVALSESVVGEAKFDTFMCNRVGRGKLGGMQLVDSAIIFTRTRLVIVRFPTENHSHAIITGASPLARAALSVAPKTMLSVTMHGMYTRRLLEKKTDEFQFESEAEVSRFMKSFTSACHRLPPTGEAAPAPTAGDDAGGAAAAAAAPAAAAGGGAAAATAGAAAPAPGGAAAAAAAGGDTSHILTVRVPADCGPGDTVRVRTPDGRVAQVNVPPTHTAGDVFRVRIPGGSAAAAPPAAVPSEGDAV